MTRLITQREFRERLKIGRTKFTEMKKVEGFPRPVPIPGGKMEHFVETEADAYIEGLIAARDETRT